MEDVNQIITMDKLQIGQDAYILSVDSDNNALKNHILNMGLTPGVEVTLIKTAPLGDPMEIRLRGYELTLRKEDASKITVTDIHDAHNCLRKNKEFQDVVHSQKGEVELYRKKRIRKNTGKTKLSLALAGNQNCGKTTLFNQFTGLNQHVGNFPGVTIDRTDGCVKNYENVKITDLPGIYSLSPYSNEEIVTRNFILNEKPDGIINIVDAVNIERNLFLTTQLIELDVPMVIALNMMDEVKENGGSIDINGLENVLGVPVIPISASKNEGIQELIEHAINVAKFEEHPARLDFCEPGEGKSGAVHRCIHSIIHLIENQAEAAGIPIRFAATKLAENDTLTIKALNLDENELKACENIIAQMERETGMDRFAALADMRFTFIEKLCNEFVYKTSEDSGYRFSLNLDKILTGKYTAIPAFLGIMALIFYLTFGLPGIFLSDAMEALIDIVTSGTEDFLSAYGLNPIIKSLIVDGIFTGVGSVLSFLPMIVLLFFFLSILEDTGYMARIAFVMDKLLRKIGLSGRSFVPMLMGFGCSVPAIMSARTLPSERDRKMTIFLTPFMSCSAKLPIYALFTAAFFEKYQVIVILSLYILGIVAGILFAYFMKFFVFKGEPVPFVMELPNYRMPSLKNVYRLIYAKAKSFVTKAFTIIFWAAILIWFLQNFDSRLNLITETKDSMLASIGTFVSPLFSPLGINDWRITTAFITGFMAKESVVSTLTVLAGDVRNLPILFTPLTAFVFLVFSLLYTPCVAAIATVRRELGPMYAFLVIAVQCSIAWLAAFLVFAGGKLLCSLY